MVNPFGLVSSYCVSGVCDVLTFATVLVCVAVLFEVLYSSKPFSELTTALQYTVLPAMAEGTVHLKYTRLLSYEGMTACFQVCEEITTLVLPL